MTDYFVVFGDFLMALPTYLLNGVLATVYWLGESGAALVSILCAALMIRFVDQRVQSRAAFRPGRGGRESLSSDLYTAHITTGIVACLWVISQWGMGAPVPWIGSAMWLAGTIIGKCSSPNSWSFRYNYRDLEADAVLGVFTDSDFIDGGTDGRGHEFGFDYQIVKGVKTGATYFDNQRRLSLGAKDYQRLQLDLVFNF